MHILLIDDHALFRRGLRLMLRELEQDTDISEADSLLQALDLRGAAFELILLDMTMPGVDGIEALQAIKQTFPLAALVVMSGEDSPALIRRAIEHGAMGYVPKTSTPEVMIHALQLVLSNGVYLPPQLLHDNLATTPVTPPKSAASTGVVPSLTLRQADVLRLALKGAPNKVIARELDISEGTVKSHLSTVFRTLNVRNRTEALYCAARLGLHF